MSTTAGGRRRPDFFIVGAPKCGTTALWTWLRQHPEIFMPERKEPNFFCSDLEISRAIRDEDAYLALFAPARDEKRLGEASVWNLFSRRAAGAIRAFNEAASIIIMLRSPVEMLYSLHGQRFFSGYEADPDFATALERGRSSNGCALFEASGLLEAPFCRELGLYAEQVERYLETFGEERVQVIVYDDLQADPRGAYQATLRFLGVDPSFVPALSRVNAGVRVRMPFLHRLVRTPPRPIRFAARALVPRLTRQRLAARITAANSGTGVRPPLPAGLRRSLQDQFAPDVARLGALLGRDLGHWVRS